MKRIIRNIFLILLPLCATLLAGCGEKRTTEALPNPRPSVYYWRTTFNLSPEELQFIRQHKIRKMYMRYFDVALRDEQPEPVATLTFNDSIPEGIEVVPTVFIDNEAMADADCHLLAEQVVGRIRQMSETHHIKFNEVQFDCDWTRRSEPQYFDFLREALAALHTKVGEEIYVSTTIRLHQLSRPTPPVDYGVLMLYNTGNFRNYSDTNPVLDMRDVAPYLNQLRQYALPLSAAYPNFEWQLLYRGDEFRAILYGEDMADSTLYHRLDSNTYNIVAARTLSLSVGSGFYEVHVTPGERVKVWGATMSEIRALREAIKEVRPTINEQVVIYHLDKQNIKRFTPSEYEEILHR